MTKTEQVHIRIDSKLLTEIDRLAKQNSRTRSGWIRYVLEQRVDEEGCAKDIRKEVG
jgi:metal-responsive CopG/Arc/MetJ family transcriptional regulator